MRNILIAAVLGMLTGPAMGLNKEPIQLEIAQAVQAGFEKLRHLNYHVFGATDGWEGKWYDERIELYQYASADNIDLEVFEAEALDQHGTDWFEACQYKNLVLLSSGNKACKALAYLQLP